MLTSGCSLSFSNERKRLQEKLTLVWRVDGDTFRGTQWPTFHIRQHVLKNANRVFCAACLELVQVQAQTITSQERNVSLLWMPGGHVALASAVQDGGIVKYGAIPSPVPVGKLRLFWIIWMSLEPRFRHTCDDAPEDNSLLYRKGSNILSLPCVTFNPPSHTSIVRVSGRTPLEFGGLAQG